MDVVNTTTIKVTWNIIGVEAKAISVFINQKQYYYEPTSNSAVLDISDLPNGNLQLLLLLLLTRFGYNCF